MRSIARFGLLAVTTAAVAGLALPLTGVATAAPKVSFQLCDEVSDGAPAIRFGNGASSPMPRPGACIGVEATANDVVDVTVSRDAGGGTRAVRAERITSSTGRLRVAGTYNQAYVVASPRS